MKDGKKILRYLGHRMLPDGGRGFDFSIKNEDTEATLTTVEMPMPLFTETEQLTIQEGPGLCYETLLCRMENVAADVPSRLTLTSADVLQHRKTTKKAPGRRR